MEHECNKKVEITRIQSDVAYIKKAIAGNGEEGLIQETKKNTEFRLKFESYNHLKNFILGGCITALSTLCGYLAAYIIHGGK